MADTVKNLQIFREIHEDRRLCTGTRNVKNFPRVSLKILPFFMLLKSTYCTTIYFLKLITGTFSERWCSCQASWTHLTWGGNSALVQHWLFSHICFLFILSSLNMNFISNLGFQTYRRTAIVIYAHISLKQ